MRNGCKQSFKWRELELEFMMISNHKCGEKSMKNKHDAMKKDQHFWKQLKRTKTSLGWDPILGKLSCSDESWDIKIKVNLFTIQSQYR